MGDSHDWDVAREELRDQRQKLYLALSHNLYPCLACAVAFRSNEELQAHLRRHQSDDAQQQHEERVQHHQDEDVQHHPSDDHHQDLGGHLQQQNERVWQYLSEKLQQHQEGGLQQNLSEEEQETFQDQPHQGPLEHQDHREQRGQWLSGESQPYHEDDHLLLCEESSSASSESQHSGDAEVSSGSSLQDLCVGFSCFADIACYDCEKLFRTVDEWRSHINQVHGKIPTPEPPALTAWGDEGTTECAEDGMASSQSEGHVSGKEAPSSKSRTLRGASQPQPQDSTPTTSRTPRATAKARREKCRYCDRLFLLKSALKRHVTRIHPDRSDAHPDGPKRRKLALGEGCKRSTKRRVCRGRSIQRQGGKFACQECRAEFGQQWEAKLHVDVEHRGQPPACPSLCGVFPSMQALRQHVADVHKDFSFPCSDCGQTFKTLGECTQHMAAEHGLMQDFTCTLCGKGFTRLWTLRQHKMQVHKKTSLKCTMCTKTFSQQSQLQAHVEISHKKSFSFSCSHCSRKFVSASQLRLHIQTVHQQVKHECTACGRKFSQKNRLRDHVDFAHKNIIKYTCEVCGKHFEQRPVLRGHVQTVHKKQYSHACSKCSRKFAKLSALQRHEDVAHRGLRLQCPKCPKVYASPDNLRRHAKRCHCSSFTHKCPQCSLGFVHEANLHKHQLSVHQSVRWPCPQCGRHFADQASLNAHVTKVHIKKEK